MTTLAQTTLNWAIPSSNEGNRLTPALAKGLMVVTGVVLLTLSAKIQVPFYPVPMTMQTYVVTVLAAFLGLRLGMASILGYMALGLANFPVFAGTPEKGLGIVYMTGPTGGYLLGFVLATALIGWMVEKKGWDRSFFKALALFVGGTVVIFATGVLHLGTVIGWDKPVLALGLYPFILAGIFKFALAAITIRMLWNLSQKS